MSSSSIMHTINKGIKEKNTEWKVETINQYSTSVGSWPEKKMTHRWLGISIRVFPHFNLGFTNACDVIIQFEEKKPKELIQQLADFIAPNKQDDVGVYDTSLKYNIFIHRCFKISTESFNQYLIILEDHYFKHSPSSPKEALQYFNELRRFGQLPIRTSAEHHPRLVTFPVKIQDNAISGKLLRRTDDHASKIMKIKC